MNDGPLSIEPSAQNVRAVARALAVLKSFAGKSIQSLAEVTNTTGLDKGTTRRLLLTLINSGFVAQDPMTQHYRLGPAIRDLAADVADYLDLRTIALPVMTEVASELRFTAFISVYNDGHVICLDRIHDMKGIEVHWWAVGSALPYNCGGAPKLLLAYKSHEEIDRVLQREPVAMTPKSVMDRATLKRRLVTIRERGYECAIDDVAVGLTALAVPVRGRASEIVGAVSIAGMTPQMVSRSRPLHLKRLEEAAGLIGRRLRGER